MIAARQIFLGARAKSGPAMPSVLEYVQDGLVVHLDARDNAGVGLRAPTYDDYAASGYDSALNKAYKTWTNLKDSGSYMFGAYVSTIWNKPPDKIGITMPHYNDGYNENMGFDLSSTYYCQFYPGDLVFPTAFGTGEWTLEYVGYVPPPDIYAAYSITGQTFLAMGGAVCMLRVVDGVLKLRVPTALRKAVTYDLDTSTETGGVHHLTILGASGASVDAGAVRLGSSASGMNGSPSSGPWYNFGNRNSAVTFIKFVQSVRYYNRYLTTDEIAHNHSVDVRRFNFSWGGGA